MSDAKTQSVVTERCKGRHDWIELDDKHPQQIVCRRCLLTPKASELKRAEAIVHLRKVLPKGSTVYTILKHVSRSGMTRGIDCYALTVEPEKTYSDNCRACGAEWMPEHECVENYMTAKPQWITAYVGHAIDSPQPLDYWRKSLGLKVGGCGMDMGFHVVNSLSYALYDDGYAIKHAWL